LKINLSFDVNAQSSPERVEIIQYYEAQDPLPSRCESCRWQQRPGIFIPNKIPWCWLQSEMTFSFTSVWT